MNYFMLGLLPWSAQEHFFLQRKVIGFEGIIHIQRHFSQLITFTHFANVSVFLRVWVWVCTFSHEVPHFQSHKTGLTLFFFHCDFNPQSPTNNPNGGASSYSNHNQQVFSYPNLPPGCLSAVSPSLPMSLFTSPGNTPRGSIPPRWPTAIQVAPVSSSGNVASEEESTDYQMVSGFGGMNPDENMLEGSCQMLLHIAYIFLPRGSK